MQSRDVRFIYSVRVTESTIVPSVTSARLHYGHDCRVFNFRKHRAAEMPVRNAWIGKDTSEPLRFCTYRLVATKKGPMRISSVYSRFSVKCTANSDTHSPNSLPIRTGIILYATDALNILAFAEPNSADHRLEIFFQGDAFDGNNSPGGCKLLRSNSTYDS
eukprot:IDg9841t1